MYNVFINKKYNLLFLLAFMACLPFGKKELQLAVVLDEKMELQARLF